jgi:hypothetical protein
MKRIHALSGLGFTVFTFALVAIGSAADKPAAAPSRGHSVSLTQPNRWSPHDVVSRSIDGNRVTIIYGRPFTKDPKTGEMRKVWGDLVPFGKIWRLGADEATTLITQRTIELGGAMVPAGAYSLFMQPEADGSSKLIVNKEIGQWGIDPYHPENELVRVDLKKQPTTEPVHELTISLENAKPSGGVLKIIWEDQQFSVPYVVANGDAHEKK